MPSLPDRKTSRTALQFLRSFSNNRFSLLCSCLAVLNVCLSVGSCFQQKCACSSLPSPVSTALCEAPPCAFQFLQARFGGSPGTQHKIGGLGCQAMGPMEFAAGMTFFEGPLEMDGDAEVDLAFGAAMTLGGGATHKIGGKGMAIKGDVQFGTGVIDCSAPITMNTSSSMNISNTSKVLVHAVQCVVHMRGAE